MQAEHRSLITMTLGLFYHSAQSHVSCVNRVLRLTVAIIAACLTPPLFGQDDDLVAVGYENPGLTVDLGVGLWAWPLPMDFDGDGDLDLVVNCPDKPYNGVYFFENPGGSTFPVFKRARRISRGLQNVQVSYVSGEAVVTSPGQIYPAFRQEGLETSTVLPLEGGFHQLVGHHSDKTRANQWKVVDFDGDGVQDLMIGIGDWSDYGWDDAYDATGRWTHGPLHGFVYVAHNEGSDVEPKYSRPERLRCDAGEIDVYGWPSPNLADFDGDGDLDLLCGEFLDRFTYFENRGTRTAPRYAEGQVLKYGSSDLRMDLQMIVPVAIDWDRDGDTDLIVGDEDGRVAWIEHSGAVHNGVPTFLPPRYFRQAADLLKCGALSTPCGFDWDEDGDDDLIAGNTAGYVVFFENLGMTREGRPRWAEPRNLPVDGREFRIMAGPNGSIQGPGEAKWGYTTLTCGDWDHDGRADVVLNSIWGKIQWLRNVGSPGHPQLTGPTDVEIEWDGQPRKPSWFWWEPYSSQLVTQWRTTPVIVDWNHDGLNDLIMLDHEGYLAFFPRSRRDNGQLVLHQPRRCLVDEQSEPLRLNERDAGGSGRRKLAVVDWDQDGLLDILVNGKNAELYRQLHTVDGVTTLRHEGDVAARFLSSHTTSPTVVDWNKNGVPDLLLGAEDGHFYHLPR